MNQNPFTNRKKIIAIIGISVLVLGIILTCILFTPQLIELFKYRDQLRQTILDAGIWAPLAMIGFQILQILIAPLPGNIVCFVSGFIFGVFKGTIFSMIGVVIGSILTFLIARLLGRKILRYLISEETFQKFDYYTLKKGPFILLLLLILPNPIGDGVFYLAGLTNIPLLFYLILVIISRIPSNFVNNLIGAKAATFTLREWIIFGIIILVIILLYYLNKKRIESFFLKIPGNQISNQFKSE
jgi:uncharacterized membrane protein YdjX (TVP38/TMEM64 family)